MMKDFHHFKGNELSRTEKIQLKVIELILKSKVPDENRENSIAWELKHSAGCIQIGRMLAQKRGLDIELCEAICALHDIHAVTEGKYWEHAKKSAEAAKKILEDSADFDSEEIKLITEAIANHSDKQIHTGKPYVEMIKDVDALDCSLYENAKGFYILHKPKEIYDEYVKRIRNVRKEFGLDEKEVFRE